MESFPVISWDKICRPKCEGDLDIRKVQDVSAALLAKLGWKVIKDPHNVWTKVVSEKYLSKLDFFEVKKSTTHLEYGNTFLIIDTF